MNAHLGQAVETRVETYHIAGVGNQVMSPRLSKPLISIVQDTLVGVNRLTRPTEFFNKRDFMNLLVHSKRWDGRIPPPAKTEPTPMWSGQQVVSALLPSVFIKMGNKVWDSAKGEEDQNFVIIRNGLIEQGVLDGDIFEKALINILYNDFSPEMTVDFIDSLQSVVATYLQNSGFSVGLSDLIADAGTLSTIRGDTEKLKKQIEEIQFQVHMGLFDNPSGRTNQEEFESRVFQTLDKVISAAGKTGLKSLSLDNRMVNMIKCGSKGADLNIAQMVALLGQQSSEGRRIGYGFQDRTLPHFKRYDDGAEARGFIQSSFVGGLKPHEMFFHAMTGRDGLIDTAVKSVTGDTLIRVKFGEIWKIVTIGEWIDDLMRSSESQVEHSQPANLELLNVAGYHIWTADEMGNASMGDITAVTRHDPGSHLYKVVVEGGASVTVSANKSLCVFDELGQLRERAPEHVRVGDYMCVLNADNLKCETSYNICSCNNYYDDEMQQVVSIERIEVTDPTMRLYDLTVPSTLNFALANGLVVRDTADSGYIQRQLVKTMEDLRVEHDGSVRDSGGILVQTAYGDDGTSATKIENQPIGLGKMSDLDIQTRFVVQDAPAERSRAFIEAIMEDRDILVRNVWGGKIEKTVQSAVHLPRLIASAINQMELVGGQGTAVGGAYVLDAIDSIIARTNPNNRVWAALLRYNLNPSDLAKAGFTQPAFDWLCEQIVVKHMKSWVVPGEMCGVIAAQSLGEPTTQMCQIKSTHVALKNLKEKTDGFSGSMGDFIDWVMESNAEHVMSHEGKDVLNLEPDEWAIMGVTAEEKACWKPISQISRHPANGGMVRVTTKSGRQTTATLSHSFLRRTTYGIEEIKGSDLTVGLRIPVAFSQPEAPDALTEYKGFALTKDFGWLVGIYLADGYFNGNQIRITKIHPVVEERIRALAELYEWDITVREYSGEYGPSKDTNIHAADLKEVLMELCSTGSYNKHLAAPVFLANKQFIAGLLSGFFDGDGNVNAARNQIRASSRSKQLIHDIARLLPVCGIFCTLGEETSVRIPDKTQYTLSILLKHASRFQTEIGLNLTEKAEALQQIVDYNQRDTRKSVREDIDMIPELGDIIAETGRLLKIPNQSRTYGRYGSDRPKPKTAIGRRTLETYVAEFKEAFSKSEQHPAILETIEFNIETLDSAVNSDIIWDEIVSLDILPDPMELVYDFTVPGNDSFMVDDSIFVHNTLNSVDWDTEIMIAKDGRIQTPKIGEFIDNYIKTCDESRIQHLPNEQVYVSLEGDGHNWQAVSCDEDGKMQWTKLEAITRHPVVNEDGTDTILEVSLESGRTVKATKGLSFLTLRPWSNKIEPTRGSSLDFEDELPIANNLAIEEIGIIDSFNIRDVLPTNKWLYGTDVANALAIMLEENEKGNRHWFKANQGKRFTVPYARSDAFREAFKEGSSMREHIKPGFVYSKKVCIKIPQIPETIPLDALFGFFCGAYVAEGSTSPTQINITNNDNSYLEPIRALMDKWEIGHHTVNCDKVIRNTGITGHTQSLIIHSTLLTKLIGALFGEKSYVKTFPDWVFQAPDEFVKGFVDGYISGDGCVEKTGGLTAGSVSKDLLVRLSMLLSRYGIFGSLTSSMPEIRKFKSVSRFYKFRICNESVRKFATIFTLILPYKQELLEKLGAKPGGRSDCKWSHFNDMMIDKIASITECHPKGGKVYDITVAKTRNFIGLNGLAHRDTFHLSGVAAKSGMTRGVPRLKELLKVTQNPKATSLTIFMRQDLRGSKEEARRLAQELEFTILKDLVNVAQIYYDPSDQETIVDADKEWISFFTQFSSKNKTEPECPWVLRLELNREKMFNKNITMDDIGFILNNGGNAPSLLYTDHNATQMIMRIRMTGIEMKNPPLDDLTLVKMMQTSILNETLVRGIPGIRSVTYRPFKDEVFERDPQVADGAYKSTDQFVLDTLGSNFLDVMIHPNVDGLRLLSNHVHDVLDILGIEAARQVLFKEIFALFEQAAPVNYRHVALLCDTLTNRGRLMSADRYGVNKKKIGPLAKASFEQAEDIMLRAALFGELDPITGVSANIMTGQPIKGGTSFSHLLLDEERLKELIDTTPQKTRGEIEQAPVMDQQLADELTEIQDTPGCRREDIRIPVALPPVMETVEYDEFPEAEVVVL
jgi:DNA-directed RNA polymerase beta' subunit